MKVRAALGRGVGDAMKRNLTRKNREKKLYTERQLEAARLIQRAYWFARGQREGREQLQNALRALLGAPPV